MNSKNVEKWQGVISKNKAPGADPERSAFVKVASQSLPETPAMLALTCGQSQLSIPVGVDAVWLGSLLRELSK